MSGRQGWGQRWITVACGVLLLALACPLPVMAGYQTPRMNRIGLADGLPSRVVLQLAQDRRGFVWAATEDGLVRLDGTGLRVWQHDPADARSLPVNYIESLAVDSADRVWVGSNGGGLLRLRRDGRGFEAFPQVTEACGEQVWSLAALGDTVWVGSNGMGICLLAADGSLRKLEVGPGPEQLPNGQIYSLRADAYGRMWIGTGDGLLRWEGGRLHRVAAATLGGRTITRISLDRDGQVWVGSNEQLWRLQGEGQALPFNGPHGSALRSAAVLDDRDGGRWIGTANGLYRLDGQGEGMQLLEGDAGSGFLTGSSAVLDMLHDHEGGVWFATLSQGLAYLPPDWKRFSTRYRLGEQLLESLYLINSAADGDGFLIGGGEGVYRLDSAGRLRQLAGSDRIGAGAVWSLLPLANGQILLGRGGRLTRIDRQGRLLGHIPLGTGTDPYNRADLMLQADDGSLWIKVMGVGLQQRDAQGRLLRQLRYGGPEGLVDRTISQLRQAPDGSLWIATEGGIWRFDGQQVRQVDGIANDFRAHDLVFAYRQLVWVAGDGVIDRYQWEGGKVVLQQRIGHAEGVPPVDIGGLLLGDSGQLWATTPRGLLRWNGGGKVQMYGVRDGLPDVEFSGRPPSRNPRRGLAISSAGLVHFDPDLPPAVLPPAQLVIDAAQVREEASPRPRQLQINSGRLQLAPGDRDLVITARLLSYAQPDAHHYRYRVHGLDRDWVEVGADGKRMLPRVPAGDYRIEVQARSAQGNWSASEVLQLQVLPVWWASIPARLLWLALLVLCGWLLVRSWRQRLRQRQAWQLSVQQQQLAEQASQAKTRFLATLGHEVRTPMTGVLGMSELLQDTALDARQRGYVDAIHNAGHHLLRLLNDALDMAGIEAGKLELECQPFALSALLDEVCAFSAPLAQAKGLDFTVPDPLPGPVRVHGDVTRLRQVLMNLLGNALKFTGSGGVCLQVQLEALGRGLSLEVLDTGPGISSDQQQHLFQRFSQLDNGVQRVGGSGLGLAISQELVQAMGGSISAHNRVGGGARFLVTLPLRWELASMALPPAPSAASAQPSLPALRVLLVEDEPTVAEVIASLLRSRGHSVLHAAHGLQALALASTEVFDVGLLDLDLPGIDGMALAQQLRLMALDMPLLAVTARSDAQAEAEVLGAGFDAFVRKPVTGVLLAEALVELTRQRSVGQVQVAG